MRSGLLDRVKASLDQENIPYAELGGVKPNPRSGLVYEGIERLRAFLISIGMPKNFAELGAKEEDIPKLADTLCNVNGYNGTIGGSVSLNEEDCVRIYQAMV